MKPIENAFRNSTGFGIGKSETYSEGIPSQNIKRLSMCMPELNMQDYMRELRASNSVHEPMF